MERVATRKRPVLAASGLVVHAGNVLLVRRAYPPYEGKWALPGGAVEFWERLEEAVKREVLEETGVEVKPLKVHGIYEIMVEEKGRKYHFVVLCFLCDYLRGEPKPGTDASEVKWFGLGEVLSAELTPSTAKAIKELLNRNGLG